MKNLILILFPAFVFSQNIYYEMPNGKIVDSKTYNSFKINLSKKGKVEETIIKTVNRNDSIIKKTRLRVLVSEKGNSFNPYSKFIKKIGSRFPIEKFNDEKGNSINFKELKGKPTLINFWFTKCPPCIKEIPILNEIEKSLKNKINFISITFDSNEKVNKFLSKKPINFKHLTNNRKGIKELGVNAFPMNLILDKEGKIIKVYGEVSFDKNEIIEILKSLL